MNPSALFFLGLFVLFAGLFFSLVNKGETKAKKPMAVKCGYAPEDEFPRIRGLK